MEAWQARECEQHVFIEGLARKVRDKADESDEDYYSFILRFAIEIFQVFCHPVSFWRERDTITNLLGDILSEIKRFARVESENRHLLYRLFEQLQPSIRDWASHDYRAEQITNPEKVFGAPSATTEVEMP